MLENPRFRILLFAKPLSFLQIIGKITSIEHDVLVGIDDRDKRVTIEKTLDVYRKLKNGKLLVLPDTPHPLEGI